MRQNFFAAAKQLNEHCIKVCSMPQPPDNADIASGIRPLGTGTDAVSAMRTNASDSPLPCAAPVPVPDFWENVVMCQEDFWNAISMAIRCPGRMQHFW